ncbi:uncharacterized protein LOC134529268 [Bacillus rossius redtenbacheri]|uniref:uncharacterized protein LOC134529268 n=1 Tax=Bacillus rossius redtenbacheri TaxID=93214 RepID=UPI002FDED227
MRNRSWRNVWKEYVQIAKKKIVFSNFAKEDTVTYEKWIIKKEVIVVEGKTKTCTKYKKDSLQCSLGDLVSELEGIFPKFMSHVNNMCHQHREMAKLKKKLPPNSIVIHMDFSENYNCKVSQEIQAFHFGGSREQVSIHTVMVYYRNETSELPMKKAYCTLSDSLRHDPVAIMAHLQPIFTEIKQLVLSITSLHFLSDGPSTQYRNRKMFALSTYIASCFPVAESITWNYSESGHGKGAPDGLGGTLKHTAEYLVAQGKDISDFSTRVLELTDHVKGITVISVPKECIEQFSNTLDLRTPKPFKGTLRVHQVTWARNETNSRLHFRRLSCFRCRPSRSHYDIGYLDISNDDEKPPEITHSSLPQKRLKYSDVYSSYDSECEETKGTLLKKIHDDDLVNTFVVVEYKSKKSVRTTLGWFSRRKWVAFV